MRSIIAACVVALALVQGCAKDEPYPTDDTATPQNRPGETAPSTPMPAEPPTTTPPPTEQPADQPATPPPPTQ